MITSRVEPNRLPTSPPSPPRVVRVDVSTTPHGEVLTGELRFVAAMPAEVDVEMAVVEPTTAASRRSRTQRLIMVDLSTKYEAVVAVKRQLLYFDILSNAMTDGEEMMVR